MVRKKLPPQPADTRVARFVRRVVDLVPAITIGRHRRLEVAHAALHLLCEKQAAAYSSLVRDHAILMDDFLRMMPSMQAIEQGSPAGG